MKAAGAAMAAMGVSLAATHTAEPNLYTRMSPEQVRQAIVRTPVAWFPAGIIEWHGEQSACGLDALKAETLCQMAADALGGVRFPMIWLGPDGSTPFDPTKYPRGTVTIDKDLYFEIAEQLLLQIEAMGFRVAVHLSGHYPGVIPPIAEKITRRGRMRVISVSEDNVVRGMPAGDHAAAWETSLLMVLRPGLVDLTRLPPLPPTTRPAGDAIPPDVPFEPRCEYYGVYRADPRVWASPFYGRCGTEAVIEGLARVVGEALGDASYGKQRPPLNWPQDTRQPPEVRCDHLLPHQWMMRFEDAPIMYWPLLTIGESVDQAVAAAIAAARKTGGMVFPPFPYGPRDDKSGPALSPDACRRLVKETVGHIAAMGFRVIVLLPGAALDASVLAGLDGLRAEGDQSRIVAVAPTEAATAPEPVTRAVRAMIPHEPTRRPLAGPWKINGSRTIASIAEAAYGPPGDTVTYEAEFTLSDAEAARAALLDLGTVENHCELLLNDTPPLTDHWPPYRFLVTGRLRPGANALKVTVRHKPQPTLDPFYYRPAPPRLKGPVTLLTWMP